MAMHASTSMSTVQERQELKKADCWNVEALYPSWEAWEADMKKWGREGDANNWPELSSLRGSWSASSQALKHLMQTYFDLDRKLTKLYTYASLRHDEDLSEEVAKKAYSRITSAMHNFNQQAAWVGPEILALEEKKFNELLSSSLLDPYRFYLERIVRMRAHTLPVAEEELLAMAGRSLETASLAFSSFNNADLKFAPVVDSQGVRREMTHGKYLPYMKSPDRKLRESAYKSMHSAFLAYENTLCELLAGQVQNHFLEARARKFSSCLEAALFPNHIDTSVYTSLIKAVRAHLPALHRYMHLRKKVLGVEQLHSYDLYVPLVKEVDMPMTYDQAVVQIVESVSALGKEYQETLKRGLEQDRWVDRYENLRKRSGAYSSGCYDSMPYILMNYHGTFNDAMTLSHEAGHSMHSFLSRLHQPYQYYRYTIFEAEVASTFHEELLLRHLLARATSKEQKAFLINQRLDAVRGTLLRQTMFAEFELKLHEWTEKGVPLTPALLKAEYRRLNEEYFGPDLFIDEETDIEWARITHFYANFYVYQYATGISAAHALVDRVLKGGDPERKAYLTLLSSGSSKYPLDLLKAAGVDMRVKEPVEAAMRHFDELVSQLSELLGH